MLSAPEPHLLPGTPFDRFERALDQTLRRERADAPLYENDLTPPTEYAGEQRDGMIRWLRART